jgi:archaellum component FlaC
MKNLLELLETLRVQLEEASSGLLGAEDTLSDATRDAEELDDEEEKKEEIVDATEEAYNDVSDMNGVLGNLIENIENLIAKIKGE